MVYVYRLKITIVNETINICNPVTNKNVFVRLFLSAFTTPIEASRAKCPIYGTYNTSTTRQLDETFTYVPPMLKNFRSGLLVHVTATCTSKWSGLRVELGKFDAFYLVKMK
jgi:hypothetical protein